MNDMFMSSTCETGGVSGEEGSKNSRAETVNGATGGTGVGQTPVWGPSMKPLGSKDVQYPPRRDERWG